MQAGISLPPLSSCDVTVTWQAKQSSVAPFFLSIKMITLLTMVKAASVQIKLKS